MFCTYRVKSQMVYKNFSVFPLHHIYTPCLVCHSCSQNLHFLHQSSRKGMGFLLFSMYFKFLALVFLDFVYMLRYGNMILLMFWWVRYMGFVGIMLILHVLHVCSSFLCIVLCFVLFVHAMFMIKCLLDVFVCLFGFHWVQRL